MPRMDNIFSFRPLWADEQIANRPTEALLELRRKIMQEAVEDPKLSQENSPSLEGNLCHDPECIRSRMLKFLDLKI